MRELVEKKMKEWRQAGAEGQTPEGLLKARESVSAAFVEAGISPKFLLALSMVMLEGRELPRGDQSERESTMRQVIDSEGGVCGDMFWCVDLPPHERPVFNLYVLCRLPTYTHLQRVEDAVDKAGQFVVKKSGFILPKRE